MFDKSKRYSHPRVAKELRRIADRLGGSDAEWVRYAADKLMLGYSPLKKTVEKGEGFTACVVLDVMGYESNVFDVCLSLDQCLEYVANKREKYGLAGIKRVEFTREDKTEDIPEDDVDDGK